MKKLSSWIYKISISTSEINKILGTDLKENNIKKYFERFNFKYKIYFYKENLEEKIKRSFKQTIQKSKLYELMLQMHFLPSLISYFMEGILYAFYLNR